MSEYVSAPTEDRVVKPRRPWLACLLSLLITGLGQAYNGQWKKGAGFLAVELVLALAMIPLFGNFTSLTLLVAFLLGFNLFVAREAYATAKGLREFVPGRTNRWWVYTVFLAGGLLLGFAFEGVVKSRFYKTYMAPTGSMIPTLLVGDHFMVGLLASDDSVGRGDIVIFRLAAEGNKDFVKRVVGLPGETIEIRNRVVYIDGQPLDEPYALHTGGIQPARDNLASYLIPRGTYFVMGDNREKSYDSRLFGPIKREGITGRALYIYLPGCGGGGKWSERLGMALR